MRHGKWVERKVVCQTHATCDICGSKVERAPWDYSEVTIEARIGDQYPEGDFREAAGIDCCISCWEGKVRPAIEALGAKFQEWRSEEGAPVVVSEPKASE